MRPTPESLNAAVLSDRTVLAVEGPDRIKFLQALLTNDVRRLTPDAALYGGFLTGQGKLLCDVFLVEDGERVLADVATARVETLLARWTRFKLRSQVTYGPAQPGLAVAAIWGPGAAARLGLDEQAGAVGDGAAAGARRSFVDPRVAALGARLIYPAGHPVKAALAALGFTCGAAADYAAHRFALGVADTAELGCESTYPLEANFEPLHGVDFKKGCYVGQEVTARMHLKDALRRRVLPVSSIAPLPPAGAQVTAGGVELGPLIAASGAVGLAMLRLDRLAAAAEGTVRAEGAPISVEWPDWLAH
jgi:folate-binding protein YgfZ